jgi:hypothetical protein
VLLPAPGTQTLQITFFSRTADVISVDTLQMAGWWEEQGDWSSAHWFLTEARASTNILIQLSCEVASATAEERQAHASLLFKMLLQSICVAGECNQQVGTKAAKASNVHPSIRRRASCVAWCRQVLWMNLFNKTQQLALKSKRIDKELRFSTLLELSALKIQSAAKEPSPLPALTEAYSLLCTCEEQFADVTVPICTESLFIKDQLLSKVAVVFSSPALT